MEHCSMKKRWILFGILLVIAALAAAVMIYVGDVYRADGTALEALESDGTVTVTRTDYGWFFDGPGEEDALIFYPGAKVEPASYAPLLRMLAAQDLDVCLVEMPLNFAFLDMDRASDVIGQYTYPSWYIGGHSLGGAMAARYAAAHADTLSGVILFAAYPTEELDDSLLFLSIYGSEDRVLNREKLEKGRAYTPERSFEYVIEGGNHAWFGNYGEQDGDGEASVSHEEQQRKTAAFILEHIRDGE
ncbi:MAG: alpha/beta hydrolase [Lachnospiraceae bacterium]|nr:alpha/beta hydrolase [Lachnospiraceae bacterium]